MSKHPAKETRNEFEAREEEKVQTQLNQNQIPHHDDKEHFDKGFGPGVQKNV